MSLRRLRLAIMGPAIGCCHAAIPVTASAAEGACNRLPSRSQACDRHPAHRHSLPARVAPRRVEGPHAVSASNLFKYSQPCQGGFFVFASACSRVVGCLQGLLAIQPHDAAACWQLRVPTCAAVPNPPRVTCKLNAMESLWPANKVCTIALPPTHRRGAVQAPRPAAV